jgi:hypothetical protein
MVFLLSPGNDTDAVRALLLPTQDPEDLTTLVPDTTILLPSVGGRAEAIVMQRLGNDWPMFANYLANRILPAYYAQGNAALAYQLCHDALTAFCCCQLIALGVPQQIVAGSTSIDSVSSTYAIDWEKRRADLEKQGYDALNLLRRAFPIPGRQFLSPAGGAAGQMLDGIQPDPDYQPFYDMDGDRRPEPWRRDYDRHW